MLIYLACLISSARSAEIEFLESKDGIGRIHIGGEIAPGDLKKAQDVALEILESGAISSGGISFSLDTPGGDIEEAIRIGLWLRSIHANVLISGNIIASPDSEDGKLIIEDADPNSNWKVVPLGRALGHAELVEVYSAGVLIFYGAATRQLVDNFDRRTARKLPGNRIPVIGVHRPFYEKKYFASLGPAEAEKKYKQLERLVRAYLEEMGAPRQFIDEMFQMPSSKIRQISSDEFEKFYNKREPYLDEWLIAKCGDLGARNVLSEVELAVHERSVRIQSEARIAVMREKGIAAGSEIDTMNEYEKRLLSKVRAYNLGVHACRDSAIFENQSEWARNYRSSMLP
jgi:hypothetical protein